jgi:hypothetical protein
MKRSLVALLLLAAAPAYGETMDVVYANTLTTQGADGAVTRWAFNKDGSYRVTLPDGATGEGTYRQDAKQFCITPKGDKESCVAPAPAGKGVGDSWEMKDASGAQVTVKIVAGR